MGRGSKTTGGSGGSGGSGNSGGGAITLPHVPGHSPALIALYWPNIVGYYRLVMVVACAALHSLQWHGTFVVVYSLAAALDALDGYLARSLNQCTKYGEVLDVVVDIVQRSVLWCLVGASNASLVPVAPFFVCIEWMTFAVTHSQSMMEQEHWKNNSAGVSQPAWLRYLFSRNFKNPLGIAAIGGTFVAPLYLYAQAHQLLPGALDTTLALSTVMTCRALAVCAEAWLIYAYMHRLLLVHAQLVAQAVRAAEEVHRKAAGSGGAAGAGQGGSAKGKGKKGE